MKKTLIALTLAALPVASMAEVVLYGQIKGGVEVTKMKDVKGTETKIVDYGSRTGFNSTSATFQTDKRITSTKTGFTTADIYFLFQLPDGFQAVVQLLLTFKADTRTVVYDFGFGAFNVFHFGNFHTYENAAHMIAKMQHYTDLYAVAHCGRKKAGVAQAVLHGAAAFIKGYIFKQGFRYGADGWVICTANAIGSYYKYIKLKEANEKQTAG